eukprot:CAMPEP_0203882278 /NCGR_PEP_ID=MMETSP0359-20131031/26512_1 /ASSEMBLY_ACC=CAM_ASM_000338 /TAXON_ID=268821 /ORGANISM="Scrippsiella Hangoei, Strain SHTV-5" /LENGTH=532 /DNA_ID=CAMNT_0050802301 /DNA_START=26 /DNA_END=1621 /DNA_ORIENTATION=-
MATPSSIGSAGHAAGALLVKGAGRDAVNGIYRCTGCQRNEAPVYSHSELGAAVSIARELGRSGKAGKPKFGWLLSENGAAVYGMSSQALSPPSAGWKAFTGEAPAPVSLEMFASLADASLHLAWAASAEAEARLEAEDWTATHEALSRGLEVLARSGARLTDTFEECAASLLATRATVALATPAAVHDVRGACLAALRDAVAALELAPRNESARATAQEAARQGLGLEEADADELLEAAGSGQILDRCAPLVLRPVELWIDEARQVADARASARARAAGARPSAARTADGAARRAGEEGGADDVRSPGAEAERSGGGGDVVEDVCDGVEAAGIVGADARGSGREPLEEVDEDRHRGFMSWINFPRAAGIDTPMQRAEWAEFVGSKLSLMNWKFIGRRRDADLSFCVEPAEAVSRLLDSYDAVGAPKEPLPKAMTDVEQHIHEVGASVQGVAQALLDRLVWDRHAGVPRAAEEAADALERRHPEADLSFSEALPWRSDEAVNGRKGSHWRQAFLDTAALAAKEAGVMDLNGIG